MRSLNRTDGLRDVLALASAVGVVGASFGALAAAAGIPLALAVGMSLLVFAGGSQFLVVSVVAAGGSPVAAVVAGLLINARHLPFGLAMASVVGRSWPRRLLGAHVLIDESVAFARGRGARAFWTSGVALFVFWNVGTVVGVLGGAAVPDTDAFGIDAAFPAALLALLFPGLRAADARRVGLTAAALALVATPFLPPGLPVLVGLLGLVVAGRAPAAATPPAATPPAGTPDRGPAS
ncbi:AzlC family ABC transporter permease [Pseudonocardia petroleophila]|uniref:AzlC family ABC transporter permease n=1 Tax=Pseudonocardia petroleophila TaxID=37331 RepID=A0A7G7MDL3_9PSEU|nr:AzlC family ABC transporter permease [Pseudonocardia petroleophila]QNG50874.1 AzlC family ABC transporter permease [Pseudonocardia petroleophila]